MAKKSQPPSHNSARNRHPSPSPSSSPSPPSEASSSTSSTLLQPLSSMQTNASSLRGRGIESPADLAERGQDLDLELKESGGRTNGHEKRKSFSRTMSRNPRVELGGRGEGKASGGLGKKDRWNFGLLILLCQYPSSDARASRVLATVLARIDQRDGRTLPSLLSLWSSGLAV